jgi:DNA (cytosine-5)-methyltransferase 1
VTDRSVVEICAGAGGQSLGLHLAGFRHRLAIEIDPTAAETLKLNFRRLRSDGEEEPTVMIGDVASKAIWDPAALRKEEITLLAGGVPCPPFSVAGKQLGSADERDLFAWAVEAAGQLKPKAVLLENVRGLNDARFTGYRQAVVDRFAKLGYTAFWELLEAKDYGVAQLRPRMILVAFLTELDRAKYFAWPEPEEKTATVSEVVGELMAVNDWDPEYLAKWREAANRIAPTIVGGSKKHGGADLGPTRAKRAWEELWTDAHGLANEAPGPGWRIEDHPRGPKLTVEMVARIQGWHGEDYYWEFAGKKTSQYRQVGNAFPPPVARKVGEAIRKALEGNDVELTKIPAPRRVHDEVYRLLRDKGTPLTAEHIQKTLGGTLSIESIVKRIEVLAKDFELEVRNRGGHQTYRLGEWKAFRGQENHGRHAAFAEARTRAKVS